MSDEYGRPPEYDPLAGSRARMVEINDRLRAIDDATAAAEAERGTLLAALPTGTSSEEVVALEVAIRTLADERLELVTEARRLAPRIERT